MINFISENYLSIFALIYVIMGIYIYKKIKKSDKINLQQCGKGISEISVLQRQKLLFKGKSVKILLVLFAVVFAIVTLFRLSVKNYFLAVGLSIIIGILLSVLFFEFTLLLSNILRKIISVNSVALNSMFCATLVVLLIMLVNMYNTTIDNVYELTLSLITLGLCYISLLVILIFIMRELNNEYGGLTATNIWKSAFLVIIMFLLCLSLMNAYCQMFSGASLGGTVNSFFDIFYYTVVTFATVGFGDIVPVSTITKAISVITIMTSVLCITILLSGIAGYKNKK